MFPNQERLNIFFPEKIASPCCSNRMKYIRIKLNSDMGAKAIAEASMNTMVCLHLDRFLGMGWSSRVEVQTAAGIGAVRPAIWKYRSCYVCFLLFYSQWPMLSWLKTAHTRPILAGPSAHGLRRLQSRCWPGCLLIWSSSLSPNSIRLLTVFSSLVF